VALAWRLLDHLLDPHFDLPASRKVVLIEEPLGGTESKLCQPHRCGALVHVWTAPGMQEKNENSDGRIDCDHVFGLT
jgi:hypothetical protein